MRYCSKCGAEIVDDAVICVHCGCAVEKSAAKPTPVKDDTLETIVKVFLIFGCIAMGWLIIPLAWCIPMTVSIFRKLKNGEEISTGMKVCTLLFVSVVSGVCLLCMDNQA